MSKLIDSTRTNYTAKIPPFRYQSDAFEAVKDLPYCAIFHEQGLGKTKIAIDLMLYWLSNKSIDTILIVTKKQLIKNWINELEKHTYVVPKVLGQDKSENFFIYNSLSKIIITNFETISSNKEKISLFLKCRDVAIVIDESAKLKNPDSKITQNFFELSNSFKKKCIMSGTPVANRPYDIWAQIYFLDNGKSLGNNFASFKKNCDLKNNLYEDKNKRDIFEQTVSKIYGKISKFSVRETKSSCKIELPEKIILEIPVEAEIKQREMYNSVLKELKIEITKGIKNILDDDEVALKRLLRLNQIASNPRLLDENYTNISGKESKLDELLNELVVNKKEKCIVWSSFKENIDYFATKYKDKYNSKKIHGAMLIDDRNKAVDIFLNDETCKVLFATPQSAKEGLTLTVANNVIFYDRGFNLDDYLQAQDRIHRISQKKTCYIYNIEMIGTIDKWIHQLIEAKRYAALLAQGDLNLDNYKNLISYSYGEIIEEILSEGELQ